MTQSKTYKSTKICKNGHLDQRYRQTGRCVTCAKENATRRAKADPEGTAARQRAWREANPDRVYIYVSTPEAKERDRQRALDYYYANREQILEAGRAKRAANPELNRWKRPKSPLSKTVLVNNRIRTARKKAEALGASPVWLTPEQVQEIRTIYETCPEGWHVDHEVPLVSNIVCGLHVPWNLRHLEARPNQQKSNRLT